MEKNIAIKGHSTRGKEVIELLEMMGGKNCYNFSGFDGYAYYVIDRCQNEIRAGEYIFGDEDKYFFTLEEFLEKYPFKVGDKVTLNNKLCSITWMCWECNNIYYQVQGVDDIFTKKVTANELKPYKEEIKMGKKLAIRGHVTRGKEVVGILEMLGGKNNRDSTGDNLGLCYLIDDENDIVRLSVAYVDYEDGGLNIFTLEEFLEKYPFKVGDKVVYTKFGDNCDDYPVTIESMKWTGTTIEYTFDGCVTCLAKDLKMWNGEPDAVISGIYLNSCDYADEVELNLGDYEIKVRDGRTFAVLKKPEYPKTYGKCCSIVGGIASARHLQYDTTPSYKFEEDLRDSLETLRKLIICRNAYWKIAGEKMGLDKPWEPDWKNTKNVKYAITLHDDIITKMYLRNENVILAFPTEEMRDAFYENFKDLIEDCKELL